MRWLAQVEESSVHGKYSEQSSYPCGNAKGRPLGTCLLEVDPGSAFEHIGEVDIFPINEVEPLAVDTWRGEDVFNDSFRIPGVILDSLSPVTVSITDFLNPR